MPNTFEQIPTKISRGRAWGSPGGGFTASLQRLIEDCWRTDPAERPDAPCAIELIELPRLHLTFRARREGGETYCTAVNRRV